MEFRGQVSLIRGVWGGGGRLRCLSREKPKRLH